MYQYNATAICYSNLIGFLTLFCCDFMSYKTEKSGKLNQPDLARTAGRVRCGKKSVQLKLK